jgi:hypothetical protein
MALVLICGLPGSGKSLYQLVYGLRLANKLRSTIVSNVPFDFPALRRYCGMMQYGWLAHCIDNNLIHVLPGVENVSDLFRFRNAVLLIDEAGVFFPARSFASIPKSVLVDLAQTRKGGLNIVSACQYFEQVDKSFRMLATRAIHCQGVTMYCPKLRNEKLIYKQSYHFDPITYEAWLVDKKARRPGIGGFVRTRFQYAQKCESGVLKPSDYQAFKCFKSFDRLETAKAFENPYLPDPFIEVNHHSNFPSSQTEASDSRDSGGRGAALEEIFGF